MNSKIEELVNNEKGIVIVDFWAPWCGPCRMLSPVLDSYKLKNPEIEIIKVNVDEHEELTHQHDIQNVPTLIFYKDGKEVHKTNGLKTIEEIDKIVKSI